MIACEALAIGSFSFTEAARSVGACAAGERSARVGGVAVAVDRSPHRWSSSVNRSYPARIEAFGAVALALAMSDSAPAGLPAFAISTTCPLILSRTSQPTFSRQKRSFGLQGIRPRLYRAAPRFPIRRLSN